jgi:hypothetical protein
VVTVGGTNGGGGGQFAMYSTMPADTETAIATAAACNMWAELRNRFFE